MGTATTTYRPLEEWTLEELVHFEETILDGAGSAQISRDSGVPNVGDWIEYHAQTIDRLLNDAGIRMVVSKGPHLRGEVSMHRDFDALYGPVDRSHLRIVDGTGESHV